jgi:hypothetical protein
MIYDQFADNLKREYQLFLFALTGRYLSLTSTGVSVSPYLVRQLTTAGAGLQALFLEHANTQVREFTQAYKMADSQARVTAFLRELERISQSNIKTLTDRIKIGSDSELKLLGDAHGAMGLLVQRQAAEPQFKVTTKSGRTYEAIGLLATEARDFAYRVWLDAQLASIALTSDLAQVQYADPNHADNGLVFSISGDTPGYPSFASLEDTVFHYNAQAMVVPHVSS